MVDEAEATEDSISMCEEHASVFVAPLGWLYTDHRTGSQAIAVSEREMRQTEEATIYSLEVPRLDVVGDEEPDSADEAAGVTAFADQLLTDASEELEIQQFETQTSEEISEETEERASTEEETTPLLARAFRTTQSLLK